jgi:DNA-binding Xre family transcriptional regulator
MAIESAADLVQILAEEFQRSGKDPQDFAVQTGIGEDRLELLQSGEWQDLTVREIAAISEALDVDLFQL